ncbi:hypothetical protein PS662_02663 [Pseudomonas fluorescens]|uniref:Uncharacterized protein n=2 Tax=Pseudomonas fluorescens TaxID=294 RepID=A0A5E6TAK7_PSEFL|nr:hypothetical protein PS662_02663 [Pseudomonas fluorescens]
MTDLTRGMIDKIETAHSLFEQMSFLGKEAVEVSLHYRKKLPHYSLNDLKLLQVSLGRELCLKAEPTQTPDAQRALENLINDAALNIQSSLVSDDESLLNLGERIETMSNLAEQFAVIDQRFLDIVEEFPEQIVKERLDQVQSRIASFSKDTVDQLANLLREQRLVEPVAGPSRPQAPAKKIIKTRYKGTLIGEQRTDAEDLVDVKETLTGKITTFHEKTPGVWVVRDTAKAPPAKVKADLGKSVGAGQALLDGLAAFNRRIDTHVSGTQRIPVEIEDLYHLHAARLREAAGAIDSALIALNLTDDPVTSAGTVSKSLDTAATALYEKGHSTRVQMIKQQPPTAARIEWLKGEKEVDISKNPVRKRLKGARKDYLDEYEVLDFKTREVLWYAHFHYADATAAVGTFTAAHLKTKAQRLLAGAFDVRGESDQELIAIYRSEISRPLASSLFFPGSAIR